MKKTVLTWIKMEKSEPVYLGQTVSEGIIGFLSHWEGEKYRVEWENFTKNLSICTIRNAEIGSRLTAQSIKRRFLFEKRHRVEKSTVKPPDANT